MKRQFIILTLSLIVFNVSGQCKKCDMTIVKTVDSEVGINIKYNFDDKVLHDFFCSIDKKCKDPDFVAESGQILVVLFDAQLDKCVRVINKNSNIDKQAILDIFSSFKIGDLPYDQVKEKLSKKVKRTDFENKILQALADRKKKGL